MKGGESKFVFSNLPKVSRENLALEGLISATGLSGDTLNKALREALDRCDALPVDKVKIEFDSCVLASREKALSSIDTSALCVFGAISKESIPFALEFSEASVIDLVHLMLGAQGDATSKKTTLSAVEEGIFSFILAMILGALQNRIVDTLGTSIHMGPLEKSITASEVFSSHSQLICLSFSLSVDGVRSDLRLLVAAKPMASLLARSSAAETRDTIVQRGLARAGDLKATLSAIIGQLSLAPDDIKALEVDDIVVLESSHVKMSGNVLVGELDCNLGEPLFATATAHLSLSPNGRYVVQISSLTKQT